ncbi:MAG TPA: DUF1800 domain-containing protein [Polaromonas sp.]|uniref:DUF1800 domain-containing protein n=1 Tax=Polaromonas sp. TaxID=1869339 RepID=UPI002D3A1A10|nr:DUF1800 domain-containing protein [Polaromonas sp.]HYW56566.1 DUF1800 domain-containing protein [Polaromonas sp.]
MRPPHSLATAAILFMAVACSPVLAQSDPNTAAAWRATSRLGYGPTTASAHAAQAGARNWALEQVEAAHAASQRAPAIPQDLLRFNDPLTTIGRNYQAEREARRTLRERVANAPPMTAATPRADIEGFSREMQQSAVAWRLMACSDPSMENALLARMTEFWFNHLNVFVGKGTVRPFVGHYVINVIRANAMGKFEDMLLASAQHPAMLFYLDQAQSNVRGLNENYARELMELHTLGVDAGYTQNDVRELARILTGWSVGLQQGEPFRFAPRLHDNGDKVLLGRTFRSNGVTEGEEAIRMLARHPATAKRIALRLATTFVADKPPQALVDRLAATFTQTQGDIRMVMRALVESPDFWRAENTLFKTPLDFACSALIAGGGARERREIQYTLSFLSQAGQPMHGWQTPDGYKTDAATWLAPEALTRRADFAMTLGTRIGEPSYLLPFLSSASRDRIVQEPPALRAGLMLASPDFMSK